jgi:nickel-dependent lactate racemase
MKRKVMPSITTEKAERQFIQFRVSLWNNEHEIKLNFPQEWKLIECRMAGHDFPSLSDLQIHEAFEKPIGTPRIRDIARGKKKVVILFDDLARPTPAYKIIPFVLRELGEAGIEPDRIKLVCAYGCHRPLVRQEMIKKLGKEIVENYLVFNHNVYEHHVKLGTTSRGTPVLINREVAGCDLKIGVGCIIPHFTAGYGGGAKIMVPGAAAMETIAYNHIDIEKAHPEHVGLGKVTNNPRRLDLEEAAKIAGLNIVVNVVVNHKKEILGLFVGDFVEQHRKGIAFANKAYGTENRGKFDLMVLNAFPIEESPEKALWPAQESLKRGGDVVLIWQTTEGLLPHYLVGTFGSDYGGRKWQRPGPLRFPNAKKLFIYAEDFSKLEKRWWGPEDRVFWYRDWGELIDTLRLVHGKETRVAVYPYATLQCPIFPDGY